MSGLAGLVKAAVIERVVAKAIEHKEWRSAAEAYALAYLDKSERSRKADVVAYVRAQYDAAGAGFSGRWQS